MDTFLFFLCIDDFNIYTREAGAGELSVSLEGPSDAKIKLEKRPHGFLGLSYVVKKPGKGLMLRKEIFLLITSSYYSDLLRDILAPGAHG